MAGFNRNGVLVRIVSKSNVKKPGRCTLTQRMIGWFLALMVLAEKAFAAAQVTGALNLLDPGDAAEPVV